MKKRTGKMISLSLAVALAVTAAPVTALADESVQNMGSIEQTTAQNTTEPVLGTTLGEQDEEGNGSTEKSKSAKTVATQAELETALTEASEDDTITITTSFEITKPIVIDKAVTVTADKGVVLTAKGDFSAPSFDPHVFRLYHADAVLDNVTVVIDESNSSNVNIVYLHAGTVQNCKFTGSGANDNPVTRGVIVESGAKDVVIKDNVFNGFFASAYINGGAEGEITNNESMNTAEGWCIVNSSDMEFSGNTFSGTNGVEMKLFNDIPAGTPNYDVIEMSNSNPGVSIQDEVKLITAQDCCLVVKDGNPFATLDKALEAAEDGDTVKLLSDITVTSENSANNDPGVEITKAITLDGNGKTIKPNNEFKAENSLIGITGAKGNETTPVVIKNLILDGENTTNVKHALNVYESTGVVIENVTAKNLEGYGLVVNSSEATVKSMDVSACTWGAVNVDTKTDEDSKLVIEDGNFSSSPDKASVWVEHSESNGHLSDGTSSVEIKGGTFQNPVGSYTEDADFSIAGGDFQAATGGKAESFNVTGGTFAQDFTVDADKLTIDGGTFKGNVVNNKSDSTIITGGTFSKDINSDYLPEGIVATEDHNGNWVVSVDPTVHENSIRVGYTWYTTDDELKELIKNGIPANSTVEVYGQVEIPYSTGISRENGKIIDGYFIVDTDNVIIKGMTDDATLYTTEIHPNGNWGSQSFVLITGDNATLENLTVMPQAQSAEGDTNKTVEIAGTDFTMHNCTITPNTFVNANTVDGGSLYFNGDKGTVIVEDCTFDKVSISFDSVDQADKILIKGNTFVNPGDPYTIGNTSWTNPKTYDMTTVTVENNAFNGLSDDTILVRQRMNGNFVLKENTTDNGKSIAEMVEFKKMDDSQSFDDTMKVTITENGKTVQLTPSTVDGQDPIAKEFKLNATSLSTKVGRSVTLTATFDNTEATADWTVDGVEKATNQETFEFTPNAKGTYTVTATYVLDDVTYTATCKVTAKSSSSSSSYDGYITIINPKNGEVTVSDDWAYEDDKITLTVTPDKGYEVDKIEIVDAEGDKITAKKVDDEENEYTFRMANCDVTVTVTFKEEGKTTEDTDKEEDKDEENTESTETTELNFTDVKESDWFFKGVAYVVDKGIMSGISENEFAPSGKLTRAMLVQMLYNMESRPACDAENAFIDVPVGQWYTDAVIWANDAKIVSGMGEGLFAPNMEITREQMVAMLYNYAKFKGYDVTASADLSAFADTASVSTWAQPAMQWAVAEGYISGMGDSQLAPQGTATRAEIASVIMRFMEATAE